MLRGSTAPPPPCAAPALVLGAALLLAAVASSRAAAAADGGAGADVAGCYDAHEAGQLERKRGELRRARVSFGACGRVTCPAIVQRDCVGWAAELAALQPSVVLAVVDAEGTDVLGARVTVDGAPVTLDGRALDLDPGEHRARVEAGGRPAVEQRFAVREGERARRVAVVLAAPTGRAVAPGPPVVSYVLGGVAVLSLASFGAFAALGKSREGDLEGTCGNRCTDDEVASVRRWYVAADVSLGAAAIAAGAAIVTWVLAPRPRAPSERVAQ